jgi:hypothetical protein
MSCISKSKLFRIQWITLCPMLCSDEFILLNSTYLCVTEAWYHVALLSPSKYILCDVKMFLFFIRGVHVDFFIFCVMTKVQLYFEKLLQKWQSSHRLRSFRYTDESCARLPGVTHTAPPGLVGYVAQLNHTKPSGTTALGPPGLVELLACLVVPIGLAWLAQIIPSQENLWRD